MDDKENQPPLNATPINKVHQHDEELPRLRLAEPYNRTPSMFESNVVRRVFGNAAALAMGVVVDISDAVAEDRLLATARQKIESVPSQVSQFILRRFEAKPWETKSRFTKASTD